MTRPAEAPRFGDYRDWIAEHRRSGFWRIERTAKRPGEIEITGRGSRRIEEAR